MNIKKGWSSTDYLNYYSQCGKEAYIYFLQFMEKNKLSFSSVFYVLCTDSDRIMSKFKNGELVIQRSDTCEKNMEIIN